MYFLALSNSYQELNLALFKDEACIARSALNKIGASAEIILTIEKLLHTHNIALHDLSFIAVNQGPGPFTTLRVVIATANGISFAAKIPLVGVDGFDAILLHHAHTHNIVLFNAFSGDFYYALAKGQHIIQKGCAKIDSIIREIDSVFPSGPIHFFGSGFQLEAQNLTTYFSSRIALETPIEETASIESIGHIGFALFKQNTIIYQVHPLYLKKATPVLHKTEATSR